MTRAILSTAGRDGLMDINENGMLERSRAFANAMHLVSALPDLTGQGNASLRQGGGCVRCCYRLLRPLLCSLSRVRTSAGLQI